jgi:DNA-binding IclR family transcriptional regulator
MTRVTDKTVTDPRALEADLVRFRKQGYAAAPEEAMLGVNAIAAPVFDKSATAVAAVAVVGSIQFLPAKPETRLIKALRDCAGQISRRLGHVRD